MLGKEDRQISFFDTGFACSHLIDKKSFYAKMHTGALLKWEFYLP